MSEVENERGGETSVARTVGGVTPNPAGKNKVAGDAGWKPSIKISCFLVALLLFVFINRGAWHVMGDDDCVHAATDATFSLTNFALIISGPLFAGTLLVVGYLFLEEELFLACLDATEVVKAKGKLTVEQEEEFEQKRDDMFVTKVWAFHDFITRQFSEAERGTFMSLILTEEYRDGHGLYVIEAERLLGEVCRCVAREMILAAIYGDTSSVFYYQVVQFNRRNKISLEERIRRLCLEIIKAERDLRMDYVVWNLIRATLISPPALRAAFPLYRSLRIMAYIVTIFALIFYFVHGLFDLLGLFEA